MIQNNKHIFSLKMLCLSLLIIFGGKAVNAFAQEINITPLPMSVAMDSEGRQFELPRKFTVAMYGVSDPKVWADVDRFVRKLSFATGKKGTMERKEQGHFRMVQDKTLPEEGYVLIDADYSQIELRILAHIANDSVMQEAFRSGADIHSATAASIFGVSEDEITSEMRRAAKAVNFGIVYGISAWSLADDIKVSNGEAQAYIDAYLARYTGVKNYMDTVKTEAEKTGFVTTIYGRKCTIPELKASNFNLRSFGQRAAMNTPIQGAAADIIKLAMVRVDKRLRQEGLEARLILQVHDELIIEAPEQERERVSLLLKEEMEAAAVLKVKLLADVNWGYNWYDAK